MRSSSSHSADSLDAPAATLHRRFVEASRRAEIIAMLNSVHAEAEIGEVVTAELSEAFEAEVTLVMATRAGDAPPAFIGSKGLTVEHRRELLHEPVLIGALDLDEPMALAGEMPQRICKASSCALAPFRSRAGDRGVVAAARFYDAPFDAAEVALLEAVANSTGHALERSWLSAARELYAARQVGFTRAAKGLNESLDIAQVLRTLCSEVAAALGCEVVTVAFGDERDGLTIVAEHGVGGEIVGFRFSSGEGLSGQALRLDAVQLTNAYQEEGHSPIATAAFRGLQGAAAAPMRMRGKADGVLAAGWLDPERWVTDADAELLSAFAQLGSIACRNADDHATVRQAATIDSLTGTLNQHAFQQILRAEISRTERGAEPFVVVLLDLDEFEAINERLGHLTGDGVLRSVGGVLRDAVRLHDHVGRFGSDEFALLLPATDARTAKLVVQRALDAIAGAPAPSGMSLGASAGIAEWTSGARATQVIAMAADALAGSKNARTPHTVSVAPSEPASHMAPGEQRTRRLATAGAIGARLSRLLDQQTIADTAISELRHAFDYETVAISQLGLDGLLETIAAAPPASTPSHRPQDEGVVGRALRERRPVMVRQSALAPGDPRASGAGDRSQLAVPIHAGSRLWGAVELRSQEPAAFDEDDAQVVLTVADHVGAALHTADLYRTLEDTHLGTAEALAAALYAKDNYTADHARSMADHAVSVGEELGLDEDGLRDVRYGAIFHDIGKIAVPDAILNKPGPLTIEEFDVVKRHSVVGEQILAPVPFLADVRRIVRHDHERWDGTGYPDGLRDSQIPIGARIVFVVDAFHAMVSDRPYRIGMDAAAAFMELAAHAGSQFDPSVVEAFARVIERAGSTDSSSGHRP